MALEIVDVPITGKILQVKVTPGDAVQEGDLVCLLESMKMENPIFAPISGTVKEVKVSSEQKVKTGDVIAVIEY